MGAGFTAYNDWGTVQIDENWATMSHRTTLTFSVEQFVMRSSYAGSINVVADAPMICWRSTAPVALFSSQQSGGYWTFSFRSKSPATVTLYVFDTPQFLPQNGGLEVFDANSNKTFGSVAKPMKIVAVVPVGPTWADDINYNDHPFLWDGLPAGNYAVCLSDPGMGNAMSNIDVEVESGAAMFAAAMQRGNGGGVYWVPVERLFGGGWGGPGDFIPPAVMIVVDVSNL